MHDPYFPWVPALLMGIWWYERSCPAWGQWGRWRSPAHGVLLRLRDGRRAFIVSRRPERLVEAIRGVVGDRLSPDPRVVPYP